LLGRNDGRVQLGISVEDTGIGIAPENQSRIFDAFTQAEANTTRRFGGTGLGLVISTRLIRLMGGKLKVASTLHEGSAFSFLLDLKVAQHVELPAASLVATVAPEPKHVMLVDDNPDALSASAVMLRSLGWSVVQAASGEEALVQMQAYLQPGANTLDAVFVDAQMPHMDGWQLLQAARALFENRPTPAMILMVRHSREALARGGFHDATGADGAMVRPLTAAMFPRALLRAERRPDKALPRAADRHKRLSGMRILLVEDNAINQQVAQELLRSEGAQIELADDGAAGVAAVRQGATAFDAVLMDLQMPVMDGLAAARALRADPRFANLPIIAMTANVMASDQEACFAAGMNAHIGKPFELQQLVNTLVEQTQWSKAAFTRTEAAPDVRHADDVTVDGWPAGVDAARALARMGGNAGLLRRALIAFAAEAGSLQQRCEVLVSRADWATLKRELHSLKGLAATVGLDELSTCAARAEKLVHADGRDAAFPVVQQALQDCLNHTLAALKTAMVDWHAASTRPTESSREAAQPETIPRLHELLNALRASDMRALELHVRLELLFAGTQDEAMQMLDAAMADLDFAAAAHACETLLYRMQTTSAGEISI
jgi:CheY-like chemotaxis protein